MTDDQENELVAKAEKGILQFVRTSGPTSYHDLHYLAVLMADKTVSWQDESVIMETAINNLIASGQLIGGVVGNRRVLQAAT